MEFRFLMTEIDFWVSHSTQTSEIEFVRNSMDFGMAIFRVCFNAFFVRFFFFGSPQKKKLRK